MLQSLSKTDGIQLRIRICACKQSQKLMFLTIACCSQGEVQSCNLFQLTYLHVMTDNYETRQHNTTAVCVETQLFPEHYPTALHIFLKQIFVCSMISLATCAMAELSLLSFDSAAKKKRTDSTESASGGCS